MIMMVYSQKPLPPNISAGSVRTSYVRRMVFFPRIEVNACALQWGLPSFYLLKAVSQSYIDQGLYYLTRHFSIYVQFEHKTDFKKINSENPKQSSIRNQNALQLYPKK